MYKTHKKEGSFSCAICSRNLTDAVSINEGVGPICRGIANEVLAKGIPVQDTVFFTSLCIKASDLPEICAPVWEQVSEDIINKTDKDFRATVKRIAWILSHGMKEATRNVLIMLVENLGYLGYAELLKGKGFAKCEFIADQNRLSITGKWIPEAFMALKKNVPISERAYVSKGKVCQLLVAGKHAEFFQGWVSEFWPLNDDLETVVSLALVQNPKVEIVKIEEPSVNLFVKNLFSAPIPKIEIKQEEPKVQVKIVTGQKMCSVQSPYNEKFIALVKSLSWRRYIPESKSWGFDPSQLSKVQDFLTQAYGSVEITTEAYAAKVA